MISDNNLPVTIISGYLGSGKTTLINQLLRQADGTRIAVLVNDFGTLAIDASLIQGQSGNVISLSGGCVCCSYGNDLTAALLDIQSMMPLPEHVVIETSGVALPGAIASSITIMAGLRLNGVLVLTNAESLLSLVNDRYVADTITRQLARADITVLNQCDLVDENTLEQCNRWLSAHYPDTPVIASVNAQLPNDVVIGGTLTNTAKPSDDNADHQLTFTTCVLTELNGVNVGKLHTLLSKDGFGIARAKGYVVDDEGQCRLLQLVGRRMDSGRCATPPPALLNQLVCIGRLDKRSVQTLQQRVCALTRN